jgi:hypothetical protein
VLSVLCSEGSYQLAASVGDASLQGLTMSTGVCRGLILGLMISDDFMSGKGGVLCAVYCRYSGPRAGCCQDFTA